MRRRIFLKTGAAVGAASLAGCTDILNGEGGDDTHPTEGKFQYFLEDETGTLGNAAQQNQPPGDAEDWQTITNTLEEDDWEEKKENDVEFARDWLRGTVERQPDRKPIEGTVDDIVERAGEIYEDPSTVRYKDLENKLREDPDPVRFTRALVKAADSETRVASSGGFDSIIPSMAEYAMDELGLDFPNYTINTLRSKEPIFSDPDTLVRKTDRGSEVGTSKGTRHKMSMLVYEGDEGLETRYVENVSATPTTRFPNVIRKPEESVYRRPLDEGSFRLHEGEGREVWPEHYVTGMDYSKLKKMEEENMIDDTTKGAVYLRSRIDDSSNDRSNTTVHGCEGNEGINYEFSDSFGESLEDFALNPTEEKNQQLEHTARALYLIEENVLRKDRIKEPLYGKEDPIEIKGTIKNPEFHHPEIRDCRTD